METKRGLKPLLKWGATYGGGCYTIMRALYNIVGALYDRGGVIPNKRRR